MSVNEEIERTAKRLEELRKKKLNNQKNTALQFFKKAKIEYLLEMPEKLKEFTAELMPVIERYQSVKEP
ncbi:MAG: hypothetical protein LBV03_01715 [Fusobacteriales bacterium]|jgi:hypothetical protein|nr:hypothetical protein [Fusobacteriales bacterium]